MANLFLKVVVFPQSYQEKAAAAALNIDSKTPLHCRSCFSELSMHSHHELLWKQRGCLQIKPQQVEASVVLLVYLISPIILREVFDKRNNPSSRKKEV